MYMYEIVNGTSTRTVITDDQAEIEDLKSKGWYASEVAIVWSGEGAKWVNDKWELEDAPVVVPEPPVPYVQTPEEIKQQLLQQLDWDYQPQFLELARSWANASMDGNTELANSLSADRLALKQEYEQKRGEING